MVCEQFYNTVNALFPRFESYNSNSLKAKNKLKIMLSYHPLIDYKVILTCRYF